VALPSNKSRHAPEEAPEIAWNSCSEMLSYKGVSRHAYARTRAHARTRIHAPSTSHFSTSHRHAILPTTTNSLIYSRIGSMTDSHALSLSHSLTHSLTHSITHSRSDQKTPRVTLPQTTSQKSTPSVTTLLVGSDKRTTQRRRSQMRRSARFLTRSTSSASPTRPSLRCGVTTAGILVKTTNGPSTQRCDGRTEHLLSSLHRANPTQGPVRMRLLSL
jgi:hypothetical protein